MKYTMRHIKENIESLEYEHKEKIRQIEANIAEIKILERVNSINLYIYEDYKKETGITSEYFEGVLK